MGSEERQKAREDERKRRLAEQLRANLQKRKQKARALKSGPAEAEAPGDNQPLPKDEA
jgi:hypothetical protein